MTDIAVIDKLKAEVNDTVESIIEETDYNKTQELLKQFAISQTKQNVVRSVKLNELIDNITNQIGERVNKYPDNFSNDDLIKYLATLQTTLDKSTVKSTAIDDIHLIQVNQQNNLNLNVPELDRDSRERILAAATAIFSLNDTDALKEIMDESDNSTNSEPIEGTVE